MPQGLLSCDTDIMRVNAQQNAPAGRSNDSTRERDSEQGSWFERIF